MKQKLLSTILCLTVVIAAFFLLPTPADAATDGYFTYEIENGEAIITDVSYSASGSVTVPDTLGGYPVTVIGDSAFSGCSQLEYVFIPDSVTTIGNSAFYNCTKLWSFNINGYGSITTIGAYAFWGCSELMHITIPDTITSIGKNAFALCSNLYYNTYDDAKYLGNGNNNYLVLVDYESSSIKSCTVHSKTKIIYDEAFQNRASVTSITIPDSVTTIGAYAFYGCSRLTSISLGNGITSIGETAFYNCSALQYNIHDNAKYLGNSQNPYMLLVEAKDTYITSCTIHPNTKFIYCFAFRYCSNLTSITIPDSVIDIGHNTFDGCRNLTSVTIGNSVKRIGDGAFYNCQALTSVVIPDSVATIGDTAFYNCSKLQSVSIGKGVTTIGDRAFKDCSSLMYFDVNYYNTAYSSDGYHVLYNKDKTILIQAPQKGITGTYTIPGTVYTIGDSAFYNCTGLTSITIPDGVTTISMYAFQGCSGLTSITIPDSVTAIGQYALSGCSSLETMTIPFVGGSRKTASDKQQYPFGYIFDSYSYTGGVETQQKYYGSSTSSTSTYYAYIPQSLKSVTVTGGNLLYGAFYNCSGLTSVTIGNSVTTIGKYAFYNCSGLINVSISNSVTSIGSSAFSCCSSLTNVTIPDSVTSIGSSAFFSCSSLTSITIPAGVTTIEDYAFQGCKSLTEILVDENNTAFCTDAYGVLCNKEMTTLVHAPASLSGAYTISDSVTTIKDSAFSSSGVITHVAFTGTENQWNNISIGYFNTNLTNATRHYGIRFQTVDNCVETGVYCPVCEEFITRTAKEDGAHSYTDNYDLSCNACDFSRTATELSVSQLPQKLNYLLLEELDITGGKLLLTFDDGSSVEIAMTTHMVEGYDSFQTGEQQLTVTYAGLTTTFSVQVDSRAFDALQLLSLPDKQNYLVGENLDMTGLMLNAVFGDQAFLLDASYISVEADLSTSGIKTVTLTYENVQTTFPVYVHERGVITVDSSLYPESEHNYASDLDDIQTLTVPGASYLTITFHSDCYTENFYDIVYVLDGQGNEIGAYHGSFGGTVVTVPGDTVQIRLVSDDGKNFYGYKIASIEADAGILHPETGVEGYAPTCTEEGLTDGTACEICGQVIVPQQPIPATGHSHGGWVTVKPATFTAEGLQEKTCVFCGGDPITEVIPVLVGKVSRWNVALADDLLVNFYLTITESIENTAKIRIYVGENAYTFPVSALEKTEDGLYVAQVSAAAAQMNDFIYVSIINNGSFNETAVYTIRQYADTVLADESYSQYHALVREMLNYGAAAQVYFDYEAGNLANSGITGTGTVEIPDTVDSEMTLTGKANGVSFYGASLIFRDRISVRYYFQFVGAINDCTFTVNGKTYAPQLKDGLYFIEIEDILPQNLDQQISLTVTDAQGNILTVTYGPMNYIVRMNEKGNDALKALVKALYNYHLAAKAI